MSTLADYNRTQRRNDYLNWRASIAPVTIPDQPELHLPGRLGEVLTQWASQPTPAGGWLWTASADGLDAIDTFAWFLLDEWLIRGRFLARNIKTLTEQDLLDVAARGFSGASQLDRYINGPLSVWWIRGLGEHAEYTVAQQTCIDTFINHVQRRNGVLLVTSLQPYTVWAGNQGVPVRTVKTVTGQIGQRVCNYLPTDVEVQPATIPAHRSDPTATTAVPHLEDRFAAFATP